jgi:hypothetical protein
VAFFKYVEINSFVIGVVTFPAAEDDADPFEGQPDLMRLPQGPSAKLFWRG